MSKLNLHVNAVLFDLDGVITNTMPYHFRAWKKVMAEEGVLVNYLDIYSREGQPGINSVRELFAKYKKPFTESRARDILSRKEYHFKGIVRDRYIAGSRAFLRSLHRRQFRLSLVTGTARHEVERMLPSNLLERFSVIVTGSDVKKGKPDPEPYLNSLKRLNLSARDAVVIENAPFGIRSAKSAGLHCIALETSLPRRHLQEADHIFASFKELEQKVEILFKDQGSPHHL